MHDELIIDNLCFEPVAAFSERTLLRISGDEGGLGQKWKLNMGSWRFGGIEHVITTMITDDFLIDR